MSCSTKNNNINKKINSPLPSLNDIDPETGKIYTKSKLKKLKKIFLINQKKQEKKKLNELKKKEKEKIKIKNIILEDKSLPIAKKILCKEVNDNIGKRVKINGWIESIRKQGSIIFLFLRDNTTEKFLQCVLAGKIIKTNEADDLCKESSLTIFGIIKEDKRAMNGVELVSDHWELIGKSDGTFSNIIEDDSNVAITMDQRHLFMRKSLYRNIFKMRSYIINCLRKSLLKNDFTEVTPPSLVETQVEGGSTLFSLDYFGKKAYLTQSSQLYLETCIFSLGNVFCVSPSFRAEKTRTRRHLTEYTHFEAELPFVTLEELFCHLEDLICSVLEKILKNKKETLLKLNPKFKIPKKPFIRMTHAEAIEYCNSNKIYKNDDLKVKFDSKDDIPEGPERKMIEKIGKPVFLTHFPSKIKPFYMKKNAKDESLTESFDILFPGVGEIVGGSLREDDFDKLKNGFESKRIDMKNYYWYSDLRKYGSIPHGGYGLGIERFLCWILGRDHIRDVCLFPRFTNRCTP